MFENINSSHILKQDSPTLYSVHKYVLSLYLYLFHCLSVSSSFIGIISSFGNKCLVW